MITKPGECNEKNKNQSLCPICGGRKEPGKTMYSVDLGTGVVVVRNVQAKICVQCGEEWIDNHAAQKLECIIEEARKRRHQIEVMAL
ncbi:MAG: type II toxin-antitoxin system MqsA family antitoxin [bacterium]